MKIVVQSKSLQIQRYNINKINLLCFYNKKYILDDGIKILAYGLKDIQSKLTHSVRLPLVSYHFLCRT